MNTKKSMSILITAVLMLSMVLAAAPMAKAIGAPTLTPNTGYVGTKVKVSGTSTTPGGLIQVYWDSVKAWDGVAGFLAESYAVGTNYNIEIVIPEAVAGSHYVIVKDVEASEIASATFTVNPSVVLSPSAVLAGDTVDVTGKGFSGTANTIVLYTPTTASNNTLLGTWTGSGGSGSLAKKPVKPSSVNITFTNTSKTLYILDNGNGGWSLGAGSSAGYTVSGTIDYVTGAVVITITPALTGTVNKIVSYQYYDTTVKVSTATDNLGSFETSLTVPGTESVGSKTVLTLDGKGKTNSTTLNVVSSIITLTPTVGYRGSSVTVAGRGFTFGKTVDIRWFLTPSNYITVVDDYPVGSTGTFSVSFTVPAVGDPTPPGTVYTVGAYEEGVSKANATFTVVSPAKIVLNPTSGKVGTIVSVTGEWFSANSRITIKFGTVTPSTTPSLILTGSDGSFSATFTVPNVSPADYTVTATDAKGVSATATFKVTVPVTEIRTRSTTYTQGDQVSIYAKSTEPLAGIKLVITDPDKIIFWQHTIAAGEVISDPMTGFNYLNWTVLPPKLPDDATLGNWNFTAYDSTNKKVASNLFAVAAKPTMEDISSQISDLSDAISQLQNAINQLQSSITAITNQLSGIKSAADSAKTAADSAASAANAAKTAADAAKTAAENAAKLLEDAKEAAESASSAAQNAVSAANSAKSAADSAKSAADAAKASADSAKSTADAAKGAAEGLATPIWIAVVLSLIAAIAAIFAIITLRRKIAG